MKILIYQGSACAEPRNPCSRSEPNKWVPGGFGFHVGTPKSGFQAKLGSLTVLKKDI